jgi:hypothetical protein
MASLIASDRTVEDYALQSPRMSRLWPGFEGSSNVVYYNHQMESWDCDLRAFPSMATPFKM